MRVLTLYLAKDSINKDLYYSVKNQKSIEQDIVVVSARPIPNTNNYVVEIPKELKSVPYRVAYSINKAISFFWNQNMYTHFFKLIMMSGCLQIIYNG